MEETKRTPSNYKEIMTALTKELLEQCEALNGGETADGFEGDLVRFGANIKGIVASMRSWTDSILRASLMAEPFSALTDPIEINPRYR